MKQLYAILLLTVLVCVGPSLTSKVAFQFALQQIDLLKLHVELLQSHCDSSPVSAPHDCADIQSMGHTSSGVYTVYISDPPQAKRVYCDMTTEDGGWLVFQRRRDGTVDFYRDWDDYSAGFGYPGGEFWLGNEALHWLTAANNETRYELRIDLEDFDHTSRYAKYSEFKIADASLKYRIVTLGTYTGNAGNSLGVHANDKFSTRDQDNDGNGRSCAKLYKGGWWYASCHNANLNGLYLAGPHSSYADGVNWKHWRGYHYSLKTSEMKIRPVRP